jgi:hypothetical protein
MVTATALLATPRLPDGYRAIPVNECDAGAPLRLCVLVRQTPDPVAGHFVMLRDLHDAVVYLGCVLDAGGTVQEWIELWVQSVDGLEASLPAQRETFSNHALDVRWTKNAQQMRELNAESLLETGWESKHPLPAFLDLARSVPVHPGSAQNGGHWELCQGDELLQGAGLPAYSTSLVRYLHQPAAGNDGRFVPMVAGAPQGPRTSSPSELLGKTEHHLAFNPQGGLMMALKLFPLGFEEYVDLLAGRPWKGIEHGKKHLTFDGPYRALEGWNEKQQTPSHLFLGAQGRAGRLAEIFHLKLQLLGEMFRQVRSSVSQLQLPFLNLAGDSFRVKLGPTGASVPLLWTAASLLVKPSDAYALPVETSDFRYFIRARAGGTSIYLPEGLSATLQGTGSVRLRKVFPPDQDRTILEGTLVTEEKLSGSPNDLVWIRLPLPSGRIDLYGHLYAAEGQVQGEARFRTVPQRLPENVVATLRAAEGVAFARSQFEIVPLLSTPCDLYSLGVLAVRALLVDQENTLAVALDDLLSLARQVAAEHQPDRPLGERVGLIFEKDKRYSTALGPHRLTRQEIEAPEAFHWIPSELWYDTLGALIRLFPGIGPDSVCRDFGDVPALALETVFNQPLETLEKLLVRSRSLILIDWNLNREVHTAIKSYMERNRSLEG